ncbi:MAG TPA: serine/threonine-protein kinase, partial [Pyrinomonadaceae bacterium]|nr:serine/threonine-protein kinase [Pyrinomonadaceae bacterium]
MNPLEHNTLLQNRYLIGQMIGRGGAGEVYLAIDQRIGGPVVMKRTYYAGSDVLGGGFESEARALERVRHQVLPKVTDHFVEQGDQFLVMDFVQGDDLAKRMAASQKPFPLSWVMFWADQILDALIYLHSNEPPIFHRDIKPQNLKLTEQNNVVLLDFGLSQGAVAKLEGRSGVPAQTKPFASLEQIRGGGTNARSDVYSLSATLYFLLTGVVPPDAVTRADAVLGGVSDPLGSPDTINPEVSPAIADVIVKGMAVSHDQRFADARGMQKALREAYARIDEPASDKTVVMHEPEPQPTGFETLVMPSTSDAQTASPEAAGSAEDMAAKTIPFGMLAPEPETPPAAEFDATVEEAGAQVPAD